MMKELKRYEPQPYGKHLAQLIHPQQNLGNLLSIRIIGNKGSERLSQLIDLRGGIAVMGSTGAGKTTLERASRIAATDNVELSGMVSVPARIVTRELRPGDDDPSEVSQVTVEAFSFMVEMGKLGLYWERPMQNGVIERYGRLKPKDGELPVYFVNNAFITNPTSVRPQSALTSTVKVIVRTPKSLREERFRHRSGSDTVKQEEIDFRMSERGLAAYHGAHLIIKNFQQKQAQNDMVDLMKLVVQVQGY